MKKKLLSLALALVFVLALFPVSAFAADDANDNENGDTNLPQVSVAENLHWSTDTYGRIEWEVNEPSQNMMQITYFRVGDERDIDLGGFRMNMGAQWQGTQFEDDHFLWFCAGMGSGRRGDWETGDYYFTVLNMGDGKTYSNSEVVSSKELPGGILHYEKPEAKLETPAKGTWDWPAAKWDDKSVANLGDDGDSRILSYFIDFGFAENDGDEIVTIGASELSNSGDDFSWLLNMWAGEHGNGYYYFRVLARSKDVTVVRNSDYSPWSEGYNLAEAVAKVEGTLRGLESKSAEEIKTSVQSMNKTELETAMKADQGNNGTVEALKALEAKMGKPTAVSVANEVDDSLKAGEISIVGAGLNKTNVEDELSLKIGRAQEKDINPARYDSTLAVNFSMDLVDKNETKLGALEVPVKITLPIPGNINPAYLIILHYHANEEVEEILPNCYKVGGQNYASFVLTSFSDFVITQYKSGNSDDDDDNNNDNNHYYPSGGSSGGGSTAGGAYYSVNTPDNVVGGSVSMRGKAQKGDTVTLTAKPNAGYELDKLTVTDGSGNELELTDQGSGKFSFTMPGGGVNVDVSFKETDDGPAPAVSFTDVKQGDYYFDSVAWAVKNGITEGTGENTFTPGRICSHVEILTFLWRAAGKPAATETAPITVEGYFQDAVNWAFSQGIIDDSFNPQADCNRSNTVTYMWKTAGAPSSGADVNFSDVSNDADYAKAVAWAIEKGFTKGTGDGKFSPDLTCDRGQIVTFLYRAYAN